MAPAFPMPGCPRPPPGGYPGKRPESSWDEERATFEPRSISVLTLAREGIAEITRSAGSRTRSTPSRAMDFGYPTYPY
jgi:hypothetical protein